MLLFLLFTYCDKSYKFCTSKTNAVLEPALIGAFDTIIICYKLILNYAQINLSAENMNNLLNLNLV